MDPFSHTEGPSYLIRYFGDRSQLAIFQYYTNFVNDNPDPPISQFADDLRPYLNDFTPV